MAWVDEVRAAIGGLTPVPVGAPTTVEERTASLAYYPFVGLLLGAVAATAAATVQRVVGQPWAGLLAVGVLDAASGGRGRRDVASATVLARSGDAETRLAALRDPPGAIGWLVSAAVLVVQVTAAARMPPAVLLAACLLAPLLARWAIVVEAHGGRRDLARGAAVGIVGSAGFREFGVASVFTFLVLMGLGQAVGLLLLVTTALATLGWRVIVHRRLGGFTGRLLGATAVAIETLAFVLLGSLPALGG